MDKEIKALLFLIFPLLVAIYLLHYWIVGLSVYGDGRYYYAHTRTIIKDHNFNSANEIGHKYNWENNNGIVSLPPDTTREKTKTGYYPNYFPIGTTIFWAPIFCLTDISLELFNRINFTYPTNGYSDPYQIVLGIFNVLLVIIGAYFIYKTLSLFFNKKVSFLTVLAFLFGSNLFYYGSIDVINSHPANFFSSSLLLYFFLKTREKRKIKDYILLGILLGLQIMTRTQDIIFFSLIIFEFLEILRKKINLRKITRFLIWPATTFITIIPQLIMTYLLYGLFFGSPYLLGDDVNYLSPNFFNIFINLKTGLLIWTPIYIFSFIGFYFFFKKERKLSMLFLFIFLLQLYVVGSWSGWHQGESFGMRMFINLIPYSSFGLASLFNNLSKRTIKLPLGITCFLVIINFGLIFYFLLFTQSPTHEAGLEVDNLRAEKFINLFPFLRSLLKI